MPNLKLTLPVLALVFAGCLADPHDSTPSPDDSAQSPEADQVIRTRVVLQPGGRDPVVTTEHITRAEHAAELAARDALAQGRAPLVSLDTGCAGSSMWIFDNTNNTPGTYDRQDYAATSNTHGFDPSGVAYAQFLCF